MVQAHPGTNIIFLIVRICFKLHNTFFRFVFCTNAKSGPLQLSPVTGLPNFDFGRNRNEQGTIPVTGLAWENLQPGYQGGSNRPGWHEHMEIFQLEISETEPGSYVKALSEYEQSNYNV